MTTIIEKSATTTVSGAAQMRAADRAAEARQNTPVKPWTPAPLRPPPHPTVAALREKADAVRAEAEATLATADSMTTAANITGQRIDSLLREKTELVNRIKTIEERDLQREKAGATQTFMDLYGKHPLTHGEITTLNTIVSFLDCLPTLERLIPPALKSHRARFEKINAELEKLEASK